MGKEMILFKRDDTFAIYKGSACKNITRTELNHTEYVMVSVKDGEVQRYLMVDPDFLVTFIEPGTFRYNFQIESICSADTIDPEILPLPLITMNINDPYDFYDAIYFVVEMMFLYDIMNPDAFDDIRVIDITEASFDIPDSNNGEIHFDYKMKKSKIQYSRDLSAEAIGYKLMDQFGILYKEKDEPKYIHILKKHHWKFSEKKIIEGYPYDITAYKLETLSYIFINTSLLKSLEGIFQPSVEITMYDLSSLDVDAFKKNSEAIKNEDLVDDSVTGYINTALLSRSGMLTFLIESDFVTKSIKFFMNFMQYCNLDGVLYEINSMIEYKTPAGFYIDGKSAIHFFYDMDRNNDKTILKTFIEKWELCLECGFEESLEVPF